MNSRSTKRIEQQGWESFNGQEPHILTPRQRLHQNIKRLRSLDRQLRRHHLKPSALLTTIELVGFKVQHLARQIQEAEKAHVSDAKSRATALRLDRTDGVESPTVANDLAIENNT
jgi:hypothetical protein